MAYPDLQELGLHDYHYDYVVKVVLQGELSSSVVLSALTILILGADNCSQAVTDLWGILVGLMLVVKKDMSVRVQATHIHRSLEVMGVQDQSQLFTMAQHHCFSLTVDASFSKVCSTNLFTHTIHTIHGQVRS